MSPGSGITIEVQGDVLLYTEERSPTMARTVCAVFSLISAASLIGMVIHTSWTPVTAALIWPTIAVLVFGMFAAITAAIGLAPPQTLAFHRPSRRVQGRARRRLLISRPVDLAFTEIGTPSVRIRERELDEPLYQVRIEVDSEAPLDLGPFDSRDDAERLCRQLINVVDAD